MAFEKYTNDGVILILVFILILATFATGSYNGSAVQFNHCVTAPFGLTRRVCHKICSEKNLLALAARQLRDTRAAGYPE